MDKLKTLFIKYKSVIYYLFFGGCTTLVNLVFYHLCANVLQIPNVPSTVIAWFFAVLFAYITNRKYVFESTVQGKRIYLEMASFFGGRLLTGLLDVAIMYFAVDVFAINMMPWKDASVMNVDELAVFISQNNMIWKIISNILVIILNYVISKLFIFKADKKNTDKTNES